MTAAYRPRHWSPARLIWRAAPGHYGVLVGGEVAVDMKAVMARKNTTLQDSLDNLASWLGGTENRTLVWGSVRFTDAHTSKSTAMP